METTVNQRISQLRTELNFTFEGLEDASGVDKSTLWRIENEETNPSSKTIRKLADAFGVNHVWLSTGKGDKQVALLKSTLEASHFVKAPVYIKALGIIEDQIKAKDEVIQHLREELKKAWAVASHFSEGKLNFNKASNEQGAFMYSIQNARLRPTG